MSKGVRWTIYIIITAGVIGFGWYLSMTERPDRYTPQDAPYAQTSTGTTQPGNSEGAHSSAEDTTQGWTARIVGHVRSTHPMDSDGQELYSIEFVYDDEPHFEGAMTPGIESPITLVASTEVFEESLGRLPEMGDALMVETEATVEDPPLLAIQRVEFLDDDEG